MNYLKLNLYVIWIVINIACFQTKACYAERVIRTLKNTFYRYFHKTQSHNYINILQDLVDNYNKRPHSALNGRSPSEVNKQNESIVWKEQYIDPIITQSKLRAKRFKFNVKDLVRISHLRRVFKRDFSEKFSEEVFIIKSRHFRGGYPIYRITDYDNDIITGTFYENELQKVNKSKDDLWRVDKVLKKRGTRKNQELFISFKGFPKKFNAWVKKKDIISIT